MANTAADFSGYLDKIRIDDEAGDRARAAYRLLKVIAGEPNSWFIGERRTINDVRQYDTAYFFSPDAVSLVLLEDERSAIHILALRDMVQKITVRPEHYWYGDRASVAQNSRLSVELAVGGESFTLTASASNIAQLEAIVAEYLLPNLYNSSK